jgi:hypothetical protein
MSYRPTIRFHPETKPAARPNYIRIIPNTEILLRDSQTWVPIQIFDMITLRLNSLSSNRTTFHNPPYTALIHDLTFLTSYPITPALIIEIQQFLAGRPPLPRNATRLERVTHSLWHAFDAMHAQFMHLQRQQVARARTRRGHSLIEGPGAYGNVARLPDLITDPGLRRVMNDEALLEGQRRARLVEMEAKEIEEDAQSTSSEGSKGKGKGRGNGKGRLVKESMTSSLASLCTGGRPGKRRRLY